MNVNFLKDQRQLEYNVNRELSRLNREGVLAPIGTEICRRLSEISENPSLSFDLSIKTQLFPPDRFVPSRIRVLATIGSAIDLKLHSRRWLLILDRSESSACPICHDVFENARLTSRLATTASQVKETVKQLQTDISHILQSLLEKDSFRPLHQLIGTVLGKQRKHPVRYRLDFQGLLRTPETSPFFAQKTWIGHVDYSPTQQERFEFLSQQQLALTPCATCRGTGSGPSLSCESYDC